jgi:hypothetical protein
VTEAADALDTQPLAGERTELERLLAVLERRHAAVLETLDEQHGQELRELLDGE